MASSYRVLVLQSFLELGLMLLVRIEVTRMNGVASLLKQRRGRGGSTPRYRLMRLVPVLVVLVFVTRADQHGRALVCPSAVLEIDHMVLLLSSVLLGRYLLILFGSPFIDSLFLIMTAVVKLGARVGMSA